MPGLDPALEYLLSFEVYRRLWMAVPILREGELILDSEYGEVVWLRLGADE